MIVAELFANLGIKGTEKTVGALTGVEKSLKGIGSTSLEAKAAIVGTIYALEQLFSKSGQTGTELTNLNTILGGKSLQTLQQYQYAARQAGVSNQETANSFKSLQSAMTKLKLGEGAPKGLGQVAILTGGITTQDIDKFMQNPELLLQRLQTYAQKEKRVGIRNEVLKSFGIGDNVSAALARNAFRPEVLQRAPTYSDKEIANLDRANIAWSNLGTKISMAIGHLNAMHGGQIVKDLGVIVDLAVKVADSFLKIANNSNVFEKIDKGFSLVSQSISPIVTQIMKFGDVLLGIGEKAKLFDTFNAHLENIGANATKIISFFKGLGDEFLQFADKIKLFERVGTIFSNLLVTVDKMVTLIIQLTSSVSDLLKKFQVFSVMGDMLNKTVQGLELLSSGAASGMEAVTKGLESPEQADNLKKDIASFASELPGVFKAITDDLFGTKPTAKLPENVVTKTSSNVEKNTNTTNNVPVTNTVTNKVEKPTAVTPNLRLVVPPSPILSNTKASPNMINSPVTKTTTQNINVDQSFNFAHEGKNARETGEDVKRQVKEAFRQLHSQVQGS